MRHILEINDEFFTVEAEVAMAIAKCQVEKKKTQQRIENLISGDFILHRDVSGWLLIKLSDVIDTKKFNEEIHCKTHLFSTAEEAIDTLNSPF